MKVDTVLYTDPADPAVDILLRPGERNTALLSVKNDLPRLFVIIDQRLMFLSAEKLEAGFPGCPEFKRNLQLRACAAASPDGEFTVRNRNRTGSDLSPPVLLDLADRLLDQYSILDAQFPRKRVGACPPLFSGREVAVPHLLPGDHDHSAVGHPERLRSVKVEAVVQFTDLIHSESPVFKTQLSDQINA